MHPCPRCQSRAKCSHADCYTRQFTFSFIITYLSSLRPLVAKAGRIVSEVMILKVTLERIYQKPQASGFRVLVDRVWPRGISKVNAALDLWAKTIAPSTELRKWFGHDPEKYPEFKKRYLTELAANPDLPDFIKTLKQHEQEPVIMLYGAKDETHNQAVVLSELLKTK